MSRSLAFATRKVWSPLAFEGLNNLHLLRCDCAIAIGYTVQRWKQVRPYARLERIKILRIENPRARHIGIGSLFLRYIGFRLIRTTSTCKFTFLARAEFRPETSDSKDTILFFHFCTGIFLSLWTQKDVPAAGFDRSSTSKWQDQDCYVSPVKSALFIQVANSNRRVR